MVKKRMFFNKIKPIISSLRIIGKVSLKSFSVFFKILFLTLIAGIISISVFFSTINLNSHKDTISSEISKLIGYTAKIKGKIEFDIKHMKPVVEMKNIEILNSEKKILLSAGRAFLSIDVLAFFRGEIKIDELFLDRVILNIIKEKTKKKEAKKEKNIEKKNLLPFKLPLKASVRKLTFKNLQIKKSKKTYNISYLNLNLKTNKSHSILNGNITYKKNKYSLHLKTSSLEKILNGGKIFPLNASIKSGKSSLKINGKIGYPLSSFLSTLSVNLYSPNMNKYTKQFGVNLPYNQYTKLSGNINLTKDFLRFSGVKLTLGNSDLSANGFVLLNKKKPFLRINLSSKLFDIPVLFETEKPSSKKKKKLKAYEKEGRDPKAFIGVKFPIKIFNSFNADINLNIKKLKAMSTMPINDIKIKATLLNGKLVIPSLTTTYAGGKVVARGIADVSNWKKLKTELGMSGESISIGEIILMSGGGKVLNLDTSLADVDGYLKGEGRTLSALMASLNGVGKVYTQKKTRGYNIAQYFLGQDLISSLVDKFKDNGKDLDIECIAGHIRIKDGIATSNKSLAIQSDKINIVAEGSVDLGKEYTDVSIISLPVSGLRLGLSDFLSLVKIKGAMALPSFTISGSKFIEKSLEWGVATGVMAVLTGGVSLLAAGLGFLGKSWYDSFLQDNHPCESALLGKHVENDSENPMKTPVVGSNIVLDKKLKKIYSQHKSTFKQFLRNLKKNLN